MSKEVLELLAATYWFWIFSVGFLLSIITTIAFLFISNVYCWSVPLYFAWIWYDRKTCERGGRPIQWVREWVWWRYMKNYFNFKLTTDEAKLDPSKNYLFACFPHGILPVGTFASFVDGYQEIFPKHTAFTTVLNIQFWMPYIRELFLAIGAVSVSGPSIKYLLQDPKGGNIVSILIGGADESKYSKPGKYKIILMKRKGFVKLALQMGSPLVPVISFGETDVFDQLDFPGFNIIRDLVRKITQIGLVVPIGTYLICPKRVPITTVVGKPIDVIKNENPTGEEIDELHEEFVSAIKDLFEKYKEKYVKNPGKTLLEIV